MVKICICLKLNRHRQEDKRVYKMINFENMATNVNNAERLRSYFLSHKQRENIINVCRARPNWDGCDYCDLYSGSGLPCWKQDDKHNCCKLEEVKTKNKEDK